MNELEIEQRLGSETGRLEGWDEVAAKVGAAAVSAGLDEVAFTGHDSPFGTLLVVASDAGIVRIALAAESESAVLEQLARRISPRIIRVERPPITEARRQLDGYFTGGLRRFQLPLDWWFPARGSARDGSDPFRIDRELCGDRRTGGQPPGGQGGRHGAGDQPAADSRALPPGASLRRQDRRLPGRLAHEAVAPRDGARAFPRMSGQEAARIALRSSLLVIFERPSMPSSVATS